MKRQNEELFDKFDQKIEQVEIELVKMKNENLNLKEKDKIHKKTQSQLEDNI